MLALVTLLTVTVMMIPAAYGALKNESPAVYLFNRCETPCWLGIEQGQSSVAEAVQVYRRNQIPYQLQFYSYQQSYGIWKNPDVMPFSGVVYIGRQQRVAAAEITLYHLCLTDFIAAYGSPDRVIYIRESYGLYYESLNMTLNASAREHAVKVALGQSNFVPEIYRDSRFAVMWDAVADEVSTMCD